MDNPGLSHCSFDTHPQKGPPQADGKPGGNASLPPILKVHFVPLKALVI